jgi:hypothetical protein
MRRRLDEANARIAALEALLRRAREAVVYTLDYTTGFMDDLSDINATLGEKP